MLPPMTLGAPTVIHPLGGFDPAALLDVLEAEGVTGLFLVPAQWQAVCAEQRARPRRLALRALSWGAAPASDTLLRQMAETFPGTSILAAFGQTEMSPVTCMLLGEDALRKLGSVWSRRSPPASSTRTCVTSPSARSARSSTGPPP